MSNPNDQVLQKIHFYVTTPYPCGYLPNQLAQSLIATPQHLTNAYHYSGLIQQGFRRSGKFVYRPHCENCRACISVRLPIAQFLASRSQKRAFKQHQSLEVSISRLNFDETQFTLYQAYQAARHQEADDSKEEKDPATQYRDFLVQTNVDSLSISFTLNDQLKMVSIVDIVEDGISAVYTFYDTTDSKASYGTYSVLWLIEWCKQLGLPYLYLGYWIQDSQKMAYKRNFMPQEALMNGQWQRIEKT
jgi:arginine-tRNA-protein transferase